MTIGKPADYEILIKPPLGLGSRCLTVSTQTVTVALFSTILTQYR